MRKENQNPVFTDDWLKVDEPYYLVRDHSISHQARFVWIMLKSFCNLNPNTTNQNFTWVSINRVAENCGFSVVYTFQLIKQLKESKWLTAIRRGLGKTNIYYLHHCKGQRISAARRQECIKMAEGKIGDYFNKQ